jgi:hypothetical protein
MASNDRRANQEFVIAVLVATAILSLFGLSSRTNQSSWSFIVAVSVGWVIADYITDYLEPETSGQANIRGRTLPIRNITLGFGLYFFVICAATLLSENIITPIALDLIGLFVQNVLYRVQTYVVVASLVATLLVFLNFRRIAKPDENNQQRYYAHYSEDF